MGEDDDGMSIMKNKSKMFENTHDISKLKKNSFFSQSNIHMNLYKIYRWVNELQWWGCWRWRGYGRCTTAIWWERQIGEWKQKQHE